MRNFKSDRKSGGFGGSSNFRGRDGGNRGGGNDRGGSFGSRGGFDRPVMHDAVCSECGDDCKVPFKPSGSKPVLCSSCFGDQGGGGSRDFAPRNFSREKSFEKRMFQATCETCGEKCEVPFKPTEGKSVFCDSCFRGGDSAKAKPREVNAGSDKYQSQLTALNSKLDEILRIIKPAESNPKGAPLGENKKEIKQEDKKKEDVVTKKQENKKEIKQDVKKEIKLEDKKTKKKENEKKVVVKKVAKKKVK